MKGISILQAAFIMLRPFCGSLAGIHRPWLSGCPSASDRKEPTSYTSPALLFTDSEISAFFRKCGSVTEDPHYKGRHLVLPAMFCLLYCCGLRCKEVRILARENAHLDERYLDILQSKGTKSCRVYISGELAEYLMGYDNRIYGLFPNCKSFFPTRLTVPTVRPCWKITSCVSGMRLFLKRRI